MLDQPGVSIALWGARRPGQVDAVSEVMGWAIDDESRMIIDQILRDAIKKPIGSEFMAPPSRDTVT